MHFDALVLCGLAFAIITCTIGYFVARRTERENARLRALLARQGVNPDTRIQRCI